MNRSRVLGVLGFLAVCAAVALVFGRVVGHEFLLWDDNLHVSENARLNPPSLRALERFWSAPFQGMYVPVAYTLFLAEAAFTRAPDPAVYHAVNLALHALASGLVLAILRRCTHRPGAALAGALVFALHPLQVESVAWISETRGTLAACLGLAALERFCKHALDASAKRAALDATLAALAFALALLAKPSAACLPLVALVLGLGLGRRSPRFALAWAAPGAVLAIAAVAAAKYLQPDESLHAVPGLLERPWIACDALAFYLRKLVWPADLGPDYGRTPDFVLDQGTSAFLAAVPLVAAAALAVFLLRRRHPEVLLGFLVLVAALTPVLGLVPFGFQDISTVADRYAYLALLGPALAVALATERAGGHVAQLAAVPVLAACAVLSFRQAGVWHDTTRLFHHALAVNPRSWVAHENLGLVALTRHDTVAARAEFEAVLALRPDHPKAHNNLGIVASEEGRLDEAREHFERALRVRPSYARVHANLAALHARANRPREAEQHARIALGLDPEDEVLWAALGDFLLQQGRPAEAAECLERALELRPDWPAVRAALERARAAGRPRPGG